MINRDSWRHSYLIGRGEILGFVPCRASRARPEARCSRRRRKGNGRPRPTAQGSEGAASSRRAAGGLFISSKRKTILRNSASALTRLLSHRSATALNIGGTCLICARHRDELPHAVASLCESRLPVGRRFAQLTSNQVHFLEFVSSYGASGRGL